ncbi:eCIS core domain-containing protein [Micromonospora chersina]|uniref:eCIS core domain-containing protein n=1 Tax=Micromonospora chersina TaxID=47854 RepID=UPI003D8C4A55
MRVAEAAPPSRSADRDEPEHARPEAERPERRSSRPARSTHSVARIPVHAPPDPAAEHDAHTTAARLVATRPADATATRPAAPAAPARSARPVARLATVPDPRLGGGRPLTGAERARYEPALGMDLTGVRLHDGLAAKLAAKERRAHAFTYGNHVVLGAGAGPGGAPGRELVLAHELAHVRQQARPAPAPAGAATEHPGRGPPAAPVRSAPLGVQCFALADTPVGRFVSDTASDAAALGRGALDTALDVGGEIAGTALEAASAVVDRLAPGLLEFLRGGALVRLRELLCTGVNALLGRLLAGLADFDPMSAIESTFTGLAQGVRDVQARLGGAARSAVGALLRPVVAALQEWDGPIIRNLRTVADTVNGVFTGLWDHLAVPALDLLGAAGGAVWESFTRLGGWLWDLTAPIRAGASYAWDWLCTQFGLAWDSTEGARSWLGNLANSAWETLRATIEPIRTPLMVVGGILVLLSPLGPVVLLTQVLPPLWDGLTWLWENWNTREILVAARQVLQDRILPTVIGAVTGAADTLAAAAAWLADVAGQVGTAMGGVLGAFGASTCLTAVSTLLAGVANQFTRMAAWARGGFSGLTEALHAVFDALVAIFQPILDFLVRLAVVVANPLMLPVVIGAVIWLLCPDDLKPPVINFVLDLLIVAIGALPTLLTGLGPLGALLREGVVGFLTQLRYGERIGDQQRIDASNKIANLAAGGGVSFVAGMAWGIVQGVVDGIIDPFRLLFMLAQLLVAAARAVARVVQSYAPGMALVRAPPGAGPALTAVPAPVSGGGATAVPSASGVAATAAGAGALATSTPASGLGAAGAGPAATTAATAGPTVTAAPPATAGPTATAAPPAAAVPAVAGAGPTAVGGGAAGAAVELAAVPGEPTDAQIVAALPAGTLAQAAAGGMEADLDPATLETDMRGEVQSEGATVGGLAQLLGDAWAAMVAGAQSLGARAADALLEFIMLPDFELGRKIGFVAGFLLLQAAIIYFSAGNYAALKAVEPGLRTLLVYLLRFLDLGGELLGVLGRALRPLRGPLMRGIGAARGFLSRFRFAAGLLERVEGLAGRMLGLGDEAALAASRAAREGAETGASRTAREAVEAGVARESAATGASRTGREAVEAGAAREAAEAGGGRAGREGAEGAATREADELGEGAVRAADEPGTPTLADDAAKAAQLPRAMAEARFIKETNDVVNTPIPVLLAELMALKTRYRWIDTFAATPVGPGRFHIELIASRNDLGDYTTGGIPGARTPDPAHVTLDRIADQYETLLTADPARHARFLEIEQLARTNPEQAARLAAELEEDLISHSRLLGGADAPLDAPTGSVADLADPGTLSTRPTAGRAQPRAMEAGNFTHANAEALRDVLPQPRIPAQFAADRAAGDLIPLSELPDGLLAEARLGVTSRVDRVTPTTIVDEAAGIIYEIKPDNANQILRGFEQARGYANLANASQRGGRSDWRAVVVVYNQAAATRMIR